LKKSVVIEQSWQFAVPSWQIYGYLLPTALCQLPFANCPLPTANLISGIINQKYYQVIPSL